MSQKNNYESQQNSWVLFSEGKMLIGVVVILAINVNRWKLQKGLFL
jgi:hypothetical protein